VYVFPSGKTIPVDKVIFELNCFGLQQRSGSSNNDLSILILKPTVNGRRVKPTINFKENMIPSFCFKSNNEEYIDIYRRAKEATVNIC
jgi:hypothetical protein